MRRVVDVMYTIKGQPVPDRFTQFKTDLFAYGATPAIAIDTAGTNGVSVTAVCTNAFRVTSASAVGVLLSGAFTTAAINITATAGRGISIGTKGKSSDGSLAITATLPFDTEPANNYLLGVFGKIASTASSATDDLGSAWLRTRVNEGMATNAGYSLYGVKSQLRVYGGTTTVISNWAAAGLLGVLEVSGASTTFASGCIAAAVYANVSLTSDATIASGAVVAGLVAISASASITDTGAAYFGVYVGKSGAVAFDAGLRIANSSCTTGISIGTCTTGINVTGTVTNFLDFTAVANTTNFAKFNAIAGCVLAVDVNPKDVPSGGGLGADGCIRILIGTADYFIPIFAVELS